MLWVALRSERACAGVRRLFKRPQERRSDRRGLCRVFFQGLALASLILALAGPETPILRSVELRRGAQIVLGVDVSKSMLAEDASAFSTSGPKTAREGTPPDMRPARWAGAAKGMKARRSVGSDVFTLPNRLNQARETALIFLDHAGEASMGLFFFAGRALEVVPPTLDQGFLRYVLLHTDMRDLTLAGSDLKTAMEAGLKMLQTPGEGGARAVVLITDGEDTANDLPALRAAARSLKNKGVALYCIGAGGERDALIPIRKKGLEGVQGFYTNEGGEYLRTSLQVSVLEEISAAGGGAYEGLQGTTAGSVADSVIGHLAEAAEGPDSPAKGWFRVEKTWMEWAPVLALLALLFYTAYWMF